jgi:hypothetical protein
MNWILNKQERKTVNWINWAQDREKWQALGKMVMNLGVHIMQEISGVAEEL